MFRHSPAPEKFPEYAAARKAKARLENDKNG